jgi:hypothetical protein
MALSVGALVEWLAQRRQVIPRLAVGGALVTYVAVSAAMVAVVLGHVDQTGLYPGLGRPLKLNIAAAEAARSALQPGQRVFVGGYFFEVEVLRFSLGYHVPSLLFDDCGVVPADPNAIYLLNSEHTPAADDLLAAGSVLLARVPRPDDAFLVVTGPRSAVASSPSARAPDCEDRWR